MTFVKLIQFILIYLSESTTKESCKYSIINDFPGLNLVKQYCRNLIKLRHSYPEALVKRPLSIMCMN